MDDRIAGRLTAPKSLAWLIGLALVWEACQPAPPHTLAEASSADATSTALASPESTPPESKVQDGSGPQPFTLPHTQEFTLKATGNGVEYTIRVSLPPSFADTSQCFPTLYTLDADYAFPLAHATVEHFVQRNNLPELLVASIGYAGSAEGGHAYRMNRSRDYTPLHSPAGGYGPEYQAASGGAPAFLDFIENELIPHMAQHYRASNDRALVGHSYGGLFANWTLLTRPRAFNRYIIVSPSLWYAQEFMMTYPLDTLQQQAQPDTQVFLCVGGLEGRRGRRTMVENTKSMTARLQALKHPRLAVSGHVFEGETHNSVFPAALSRGLRRVYPHD